MTPRTAPPAKQAGAIKKTLYLVAGVALLMVGLMGLVLPVIPGLLFLVVAVWLLAKVSRRVRAFSHRNETLRAFHHRLDRVGSVRWFDQVKVVGLTLLDVTVRGIDSGIRLVTNLFKGDRV